VFGRGRVSGFGLEYVYDAFGAGLRYAVGIDGDGDEYDERAGKLGSVAERSGVLHRKLRAFDGKRDDVDVVVGTAPFEYAGVEQLNAGGNVWRSHPHQLYVV